jgi:hypothetical protein
MDSDKDAKVPVERVIQETVSYFQFLQKDMGNWKDHKKTELINLLCPKDQRGRLRCKVFPSNAFYQYALLAGIKREAFDLLTEVAAEWLKFKNTPMEVKIFAGDVLSGKKKRPRQHGKIKNDSLNEELAGHVAMAVFLGYPVGRNRKNYGWDPAKRIPPNAVDMVVYAARQAGIKTTYDAVKTLYYRYRDDGLLYELARDHVRRVYKLTE